jgi:hypothetical protein
MPVVDTVEHRLTWAEPPTIKRGRPTSGNDKRLKYDRALAKVQEKPGKWARIAVFQNHKTAYVTAGYLRKERITALGLDPKDFEVRGVKNERDGQTVGELYVMYKGGESTDEPADDAPAADAQPEKAKSSGRKRSSRTRKTDTDSTAEAPAA